MKYTPDEVIQYVQEEDVKFIRMAFCDVYGKQRNVAIMPTELPRAFEYGIAIDASAIPGFRTGHRSDLFLRPNADTLKELPWRPQHGRVAHMFCDIAWPDGSPFQGDSRAVLKSAAYSIKPDVIFIDGAADFVPDPNDSGMSKALTDDFCSISDNCDCSIIAVVHSSKDDRGRLKAGGHLGGYLGRKDSCAMLVYRSGPVITVQFTHGRSSGFNPFSFSILQDGSFQLVTVEKSAHKEKAGPSAVLTKILEVLQPGKEFKTSDIVSALEDFGFNRTNVQNNLKTAVETGQIQQIRRGVYAANSQPENA